MLNLGQFTFFKTAWRFKNSKRITLGEIEFSNIQIFSL